MGTPLPKGQGNWMYEATIFAMPVPKDFLGNLTVCKMPSLLPCRVASFRYKQIRGVNVSVTLNLKKSEK
jgi:hypothetical protein